jgi:type IV pilus assembly protein PilY1
MNSFLTGERQLCMNIKQRISNLLSVTMTAACIAFAAVPAEAANLALSDSPLFLSAGVPPLNMLVMGRDHKLYYEAYNDHSDLNGDGVLDTKYKPTQIDYFGYFDSKKCYSYSNGTPAHFYPVSETTNKKCSGTWSGDFLNYLTTSRMDAMRKVLYGGFRSTDTASETILERSHVPQDAHSWGKEYNSTDGYLINEYSPLAMPSSGRHLFANTTPQGSGSPRLRILLNRSERIWNWVSKERPVADTSLDGGTTVSAFDDEFRVRVKVCDAASALAGERNCQAYPDGNSKPTGLLQDYGENDSMLFGLLTGSYAKNTSGGVLRRAVGSVKDEINLNNGTFVTAYNGIITTLNRLQTTGFNSRHEYNCGWTSASRVITEGECQMWGNPVAEMMYEALRYFAGKGAPTGAFATAFGDGEESDLPGNGLPVASWDNPYTGRPVCTKPFQTVISDVNNSYDTDQLPGVDASFGSFGGDVTGLNVASIGQTIWNSEIGGTHKYFIGQSGASADDAPTPKDVSSFGNIRGLAPEEPTKQGGYYAASVANFGRTTDISAATGTQNMSTFAVALASPLPKIEIPLASGRKVTIVPFSKSVGGCLGADGAFKATNQIVDFYVDSLTATSGRFRVNFEDVEQGADHDMDAITVYEYSVSGNTVTVTLTSEYAAGCIIQHSGYVISGTESDGVYLVVRDVDTAAADDPDYSLDAPNDSAELPLTSTRTFIAGSTPGADILKDPLWYAAKWGGFKETTSPNNVPDVQAEWDEDNNGQPDNYFLVTNALNLGAQLSKAFSEIIARVASASSASVNSGSINSGSRLYQAKFNSGNWTGQLLAYPINPDGSLGTTLAWDAADQLPLPDARTILTVNSDGSPVPFKWPDGGPTSGLDTTRQRQLDNAVSSPWNTGLQRDRLDYLRGSSAKEGEDFRRRVDQEGQPNKLGDVISSSPVYVGRPSFTYSDTLESAAYSTFRTNNTTRTPVVYVGGNDGMLHGFNAATGAEILGFVPSSVFGNLKALTNRGYTHKFFVDGSPTVADAFVNSGWKTVLVGGLNAGGQGIYALNITDPTNFTEANAAYSSANQNGVVMWEFTDRDGASTGITGDADLGATYSQPIVVRVRNNTAAQRWVAIFGNGYNNTVADGSASTTGNAVLYVVDLATGRQIRKITTGVGTSATYSGGKPNGLTSPTAADLDGDGIVENVYAGDLFGNLWKFNLNNADPSLWSVAYSSSGNPAPLFVATDSSGTRQPITSQVRIARGPGSTGAIISFGTGKFLEATDKSTTSAQTLYGIYDNYTNTASDVVSGRTNLLQQTIAHEVTQTFGTTSREVRVTSANNPTTGTRGWYLDLLTPAGANTGERMIANPRIRNGRILFVSIVPGSDPCAPGGKSRLTELDVVTGGAPPSPPFDLNGDGRIDDNDLVTITLPDGTTQRVAPASLTLIVDYATSPGVIASSTADYVYISGDDRDRPPGDLGSEDIQGIRRAPGDNAHGRQSWRQIR